MSENNEPENIRKAEGAMHHLLMAYNEMIPYTLEGAGDLRSGIMNVIHELEGQITTTIPPVEEINTGYDEDKRNRYTKEIVQEEGQYCV